MKIKEELLELLDCPKCKSGKGLIVQEQILFCEVCESEFPMKKVDGPQDEGFLIPDFLEEG